MNAIFRLALRNLSEHKSKTIIIALFLVFGIAIVIMGNSFLESINRGLEKDFRANYTGDIAIHCNPDPGILIDIFSAQSVNLTDLLPQIPAIPELDKVQEIVNSTEGISHNTKQITAQVLAALGDEMDMSVYTEKAENEGLSFDDLPVSELFAGEQETFWETFPGINFVEGTYPAKNTNEVMIDTRVRDSLERLYGEKVNIGDKILLAGASMNTKVRDAIVSGIFKPANEYSAMFQIIYCDASFARSFADLTYASSFDNELPSNVDLALSDMSEDDLFGMDDDFLGIDEDTDILADSSFDFDSILGDTTLRDELNKTDDGAWHFVLLKVKDGYSVKKIIAELNQQFVDNNINVRAVDWKAAAASYSDTVEGIGFIFNLLIIILAIVVFIIIMNTMIVSVIERTGEIGTMRAIGAEKNFVRKLFYTEALFLTSVSAIIGMIIAFVAMGIFNACNITITNSIAKMILGGGLLHFSPTVPIILTTIIVALAGSVISNLYPVSSALKITPLKALSKGSD